MRYYSTCLFDHSCMFIFIFASLEEKVSCKSVFVLYYKYFHYTCIHLHSNAPNPPHIASMVPFAALQSYLRSTVLPSIDGEIMTISVVHCSTQINQLNYVMPRPCTIKLLILLFHQIPLSLSSLIVFRSQ